MDASPGRRPFGIPFLAVLALLCGPVTNAFAAFDMNRVVAYAEELAKAPFKDPAGTVPKWLLDVSYDQWRDIRFRPDRSLWLDGKQRFTVQFFHPGLYYDRVVGDQRSRRLGGCTRFRFRRANSTTGRTTSRAACRRIWVTPASASTTRSTGPTTATRSSSSSAGATSAPSARTSRSACPPADWRSTPRYRRARSSPTSRSSGWFGRRSTRPRWSSTRFSTARGSPVPTGSRSGPASRPWSRCSRSSSHAKRSPKSASRRSPACFSTARTRCKNTTTSGPRCTTPMVSCCGFRPANGCGGRSTTRRAWMSARSACRTRRASAFCSATATSITTRSSRPTRRRARARG